MIKKEIMLAAFIGLNVHGVSYAAVPGSFYAGATQPVTESQHSTTHPEQYIRYVAATSGQLSESTSKARSSPAAADRRVQVQTTITQLITSSQRAAADIRSEVEKIKVRQGSRASAADIQSALDMADKLDQYVLKLTRQARSLKDNERNTDQAGDKIKAMTEQTALDMLELQDRMIKSGQVMQVMSNIMKMQHETLTSVIRNIK